MKVYILTPAYEWCRVLAGFTASPIDCHWRGDPPLSPCEAGILNKSLAALLEILQIGTIPLCRTDLNRGREKNLVNGTVSEFGRRPDSCRWRYFLHPGLWSLSSLMALLDQLATILLMLDKRNPGALERVGGTHDEVKHCIDIEPSYRISRASLKKWSKDALVAVCCTSVGTCARSVGGVLGGPGVWERLSYLFDFAYHCCGGPYPVFWCGIMEKGQPNEELRMSCRFFRKRALMKRAANLTDRLNETGVREK